MTNKKPNFIYKFDGKEYSKEEQAYLIFRFIQVLQRLSKKQKSRKPNDSEKSKNCRMVE